MTVSSLPAVRSSDGMLTPKAGSLEEEPPPPIRPPLRERSHELRTTISSNVETDQFAYHHQSSSPAHAHLRIDSASPHYYDDSQAPSNLLGHHLPDEGPSYGHALSQARESDVKLRIAQAERMRPPQPARGQSTHVQGIELIPTRRLPDRFRSIFPYPVFNAIQSKCFRTAFEATDNLVLSSPTGSGKTVVLELAICRTVCDCPAGQFKIVYQAPTKALCSERLRDWEQKFRGLDLKCAELTGDTDIASLRNAQHADIMITTPEKWDSMTRKWQDHERLMQMVKLFLIDEVHILKEDRGATLEAVVSRMKSIGSQVRFVALSATVPNSEDIASWLGKDSINQGLPAVRERFGEEFRPVKLQKHVCGYLLGSNDFAFDKMLDSK